MRLERGIVKGLKKMSYSLSALVTWDKETDRVSYVYQSVTSDGCYIRQNCVVRRVDAGEIRNREDIINLFRNKEYM